MKLYPAIDIRDGNVVRLYKGEYNDETIYGDDPLQVAKSFEAAGAPWVHIVDLDAAKTGSPANRPIIANIAAALTIPVQTGGGVRDHVSMETLLEAGVSRVVLGTVAIKDPETTQSMLQAFPGKAAIGLDARGGKVAAQGWTDTSELTVLQLVQRYSQFPAAAFVITDIDRDGTLTGPDVEGLQAIVKETDIDVIASGGVGSLDDLRALKRSGVAGVITGKAIYEGCFTVAEALEACR